jgi:membrane fusion protein (multidrug efflux system)
MAQTQVKKEKNGKVYIPLMVIIALILGGVTYWYIDYKKYINTDDAHVESDMVAVSPKILGRIIKLYAEEGDSVKKGQLLAELDSTDFVAQKTQAIANHEQAETAVGQAEAKYQSDLKNINVTEVLFAKAQDDYTRGETQFKGDVITREQYDHIKKALETAQAQLNASRAQAKVSIAQIVSARASVESAGAQIGVIQTQINNTRLFAPVSGLIGKRWLLPGDIAQPGQAIYNIISSGNLWVSIYLEETKLKTLRIGQPVIFTLDTYPGVTFTGKIFTLGSNTAATFSLIPANNASGNYTKVTQRVQLKVSIDGIKGGGSLSAYRILSGMSAIVKIIR